MKGFVLSLVFAATAAALPGASFRTAGKLPAIKSTSSYFPVPIEILIS